ncbi:conserved hypothetical protein [Talaromyces stipitatus ATCC 10500]|uniref:Indole-diterpene biosynthesis protein PaxU n=1 Tax=Talaromyces stipitatus (strain ATCC 10500 / CBS 375.48 / QM 6759 / NRRL 1006) TaxID=441959 RepID=B8MKE1_TALSN|nr:uncharacterized protein TSTA_047450 [Talaromyces stipitatus ATCC 10500]EED15296.1 conserved hypothetical protein [Talaromyces stipitatus ATCC 10500]
MENYTYVQANPSVSLYTANKTTSEDTGTKDQSPNPPSLIALLPWMGATKRQTETYIRGHIKLFSPSQPNFLVIYSGITDFLSPTQGNDRRLQPAITTLAAYEPSSILFHIFSNGGVRVFANLARSYGSTASPKRRLCSRIVIDSAPGRLTFKETMRAVNSALPRNQPLIKWPLYTILAVVLALYLGLNKTLAWPDPLQFAAESFNDAGIVGKDSRRCYFYSKRDGIVLSGFVEQHAAEAREKGLGIVEMEMFEKSAHTGHVIEDEERYWGAGLLGYQLLGTIFC